MKKIVIGSIMLGSMLNLFAGNILNAQTANWQWAGQGKGSGHDYGHEVATDSFGNAYICGRFQPPSCLFGSVNLQVPITNGESFFIAKIDSNGQHIWAKTAQSGLVSTASGITTDIHGNSMVVGEYTTQDTFSLGPVSLTSNLGNTAFVAGYDAQGNVKWAKDLGVVNNTLYGRKELDVAIDQQGFGRITGNFDDTTYLIKIDQMGNEIWRKKFSAPTSFTNTYFGKLSVDSKGNTYVVCTSYASSLSFDNLTVTNTNNGGLLTVKVDANGNVLWAKFDGALSSIHEPAVCTDASGNYFVCGSFLGSNAQFGGVTLNNASGVEDMFICKYDSLGTLQWAKRAGGIAADMAKNIHADASGNVYMTGFFRGVAMFDPQLVNGTAAPEVFVAKYDNSNGNCMWVKKGGGTDVDMGHGVHADAFGAVWMVGHFFSDTCLFDNHAIPNSSPPSYPAEVLIARIKTSQTTTAGGEVNALNDFIRVYPNPGNGLYKIDGSKLQSPIRNWKLMDALGARVMEAQAEDRIGVFQLDLKHLPAGIYFLQLNDEGGKTYRHRIVKR